MTFNETKNRFIDFLYSRGEYIRSVGSGEYQTRCPFCGDSTHSLNTGHFYINIDVDSPTNIPYICFKCNESGIVDPNILDLLGNDDEDLRNGIIILNKTGKIRKSYNKENHYLTFDYHIPQKIRYPKKIKYVENRIETSFSESDLIDMKMITSLYDFLLENELKTSPFKKSIREILEKDYVGFLSSGNSHILFRDITETHEYRWIKYPIDVECKKNRVFYSFSDPVNVFGKDEIIVNLSEGVMDVLGIKYHVETHDSNVINIAICGQNFNNNIRHLIEIGIFGSNVILNIYQDNDIGYNEKIKDEKKKAKEIEKRNVYISKYKPLFKEINTFLNLKSKDYGVKKSEIILKKSRI